MILFQNNRVNSLLYFFVTPDEIQCSSLYTNQALHSLLIHMHLLISGYLLRTPDNSNFFFQYSEGSRYREWTVFHYSFFIHLLETRGG